MAAEQVGAARAQALGWEAAGVAAAPVEQAVEQAAGLGQAATGAVEAEGLV